MISITISRSDQYMNALRNYKIFVDGTNIGTVALGETKTFEVPQDSKLVTAKIDWCTSNTLALNSATEERFELKSSFTVLHFAAVCIILFAGISFLEYFKLLSEEGWIYVLLFATMPYIFIFGLRRKRYLKLEKTSG